MVDDVARGGSQVGKIAFKVGDEIAGIRIDRIKPGTNGKVAIIGRAMGNKNMKGVRDVFKELQMKGYKDIEIFDKSSLTDKWLIRYEKASSEMDELTRNWTKWLNNQEIAGTEMYKLNKEWAEKLVNEKYTIIDMGDIPAKAGDYKGFSPFYGIEKKVIFGGE